MTEQLEPGGVYIGDDGEIFRVRGIVGNYVIADEIGPKKCFGVDSRYREGVMPIDLELPESSAEIMEFMNDTSVKSLREMVDHWRTFAVEQQHLAHERRSWFSKAGDWLGLFFVVIPYRLYKRATGYTGPFS